EPLASRMSSATAMPIAVQLTVNSNCSALIGHHSHSGTRRRRCHLRSLDSTACSCCCPLIIPSYAKTAPKLPAQAFPEPITAADQSLAAGSAEPLEQAHLRPAIGGETDRNLRKAPALH